VGLDVAGESDLQRLLQIAADVVDDGLKVPLGGVELTLMLVGVGLIGQDGEDELPVYGLAEAGSSF
jgi:hypothetical protein